MADFLQVKIEGMAEARKALQRMERLEGVKDGLVSAAVYLKGKFSEYPPQKRIARKRVYGETFKSDKQRRYVFAAMKRGEIPYMRGTSAKSQALGRRWARETRRGGLEQVIGNNARYAEYVQGDEQSEYMRRVGWRKMSDIAKREEGNVNRIVNQYVKRNL